MTFRTRSLFSAAVVLLCSTASAVADPITAVYDVLVTERMTDESNPDFLPFEQQFTLYLTFDPALGGDRSYGPAQFSPVPLPSVAPPLGLPLTTGAFTAHGRFEENPFGASNLFASATVNETHLGPEWHFFKTTRLITNMPTTDPAPPFTAETFPAHLVLGSPFNFDYGTTLFRMTPTLQLVDSLQYRGSATLLRVTTVEPIPEPATLALVGGGLLLLARRRARGRH